MTSLSKTQKFFISVFDLFTIRFDASNRSNQLDVKVLGKFPLGGSTAERTSNDLTTESVELSQSQSNQVEEELGILTLVENRLTPNKQKKKTKNEGNPVQPSVL